MTAAALPAERYVLLDGLRGVAALMVTVLHATQAMPWFVANANHAQLSVDFFFAMSGFVLSHAYATRLNLGMTIPAFMRRRWIRLTPMVVVGTSIATLAYAVKMVRLDDGARLVWLLGGSLLNANYLPSPWLLDLDSGSAYLANPPIWSLTAEMLASLVFAAGLFRASRRQLVVLLLMFAVALMVCSLHFNAIDHGWQLDRFLVGWVRVAFSFTAGVLLQRLRVSIDQQVAVNSGTPATPQALLSMVILVALAYLPVPDRMNGGYEFLCVALLFPALILAASGWYVVGRMAQFCVWLGELSFPLYALHYGVLRLCQPIRSSPWMASHLVLTLCVEIAVSVGIAWLAGRLIDRPVRMWLGRYFGDGPGVCVPGVQPAR